MLCTKSSFNCCVQYFFFSLQNLCLEISVHISVFPAMTGVTRFHEIYPKWKYVNSLLVLQSFNHELLNILCFPLFLCLYVF